MFRAFPVTAAIFGARQIIAFQPQRAAFHNVRLVELHDALHTEKKENLKLDTIRLHEASYTQVPLNKSPNFQYMKQSHETGKEIIKEGPVYNQYGPLFKNVSSTKSSIKSAITQNHASLKDLKTKKTVADIAESVVTVAEEDPEDQILKSTKFSEEEKQQWRNYKNNMKDI